MDRAQTLCTTAAVFGGKSSISNIWADCNVFIFRSLHRNKGEWFKSKIFDQMGGLNIVAGGLFPVECFSLSSASNHFFLQLILYNNMVVNSIASKNHLSKTIYIYLFWDFLLSWYCRFLGGLECILVITESEKIRL